MGEIIEVCHGMLLTPPEVPQQTMNAEIPSPAAFFGKIDGAEIRRETDEASNCREFC